MDNIALNEKGIALFIQGVDRLANASPKDFQRILEKRGIKLESEKNEDRKEMKCQ